MRTEPQLEPGSLGSPRFPEESRDHQTLRRLGPRQVNLCQRAGQVHQGAWPGNQASPIILPCPALLLSDSTQSSGRGQGSGGESWSQHEVGGLLLLQQECGA